MYFNEKFLAFRKNETILQQLPPVLMLRKEGWYNHQEIFLFSNLDEIDLCRLLEVDVRLI